MPKRRLLILALVIVAGVLSGTGARAETPCPEQVCVVITGTVLDAHGSPVPSYNVAVLRADKYGTSTTSADDGSFRFALPPVSSGNCYQIYGSADPYFSNSSVLRKACVSTNVVLHPHYRIQGVSGYQKVYLGDTAQTVTIPVEVSALSRTFPAAFASDPLAYDIERYNAPGEDASAMRSAANKEHASGEEPSAAGDFGSPIVRKIGDHVWQYIWKRAIVMPDHQPGFYDMNWATRAHDRASVFSPMMDCRMVWFGYGLSSLSPAKALPGETITLTGQHLGNEPGKVLIKGSGQVTTIDGSSIVSWSSSSVTFVLPPGAKSGWVAAVPPHAIRTNGRPLTVGP